MDPNLEIEERLKAERDKREAYHPEYVRGVRDVIVWINRLWDDPDSAELCQQLSRALYTREIHE